MFATSTRARAIFAILLSLVILVALLFHRSSPSEVWHAAARRVIKQHDLLDDSSNATLGVRVDILSRRPTTADMMPVPKNNGHQLAVSD